MRFFKFIPLTSSSGFFDKLPAEVETAILKFLPVKNQIDIANTCNAFRNKVREMYRGPVLTMIENLDLDHFKIESDEKLYKEMETFTKAMFSTIQGFYHLEYKHKDDRSFKDDFLAKNKEIQDLLNLLFQFLPKSLNHDCRDFKYDFIAKHNDIQDFILKLCSVFYITNELFKNLELPKLNLFLLKLTDKKIDGDNGVTCMIILMDQSLRKPEKLLWDRLQFNKYVCEKYFEFKRNRELVKYQFENKQNIILVYFVYYCSVFILNIFMFLIYIISITLFKLKNLIVGILSKPQYLIAISTLIPIHYQYNLIQNYKEISED